MKLVAEVGARGTSWDLLWDPAREKQYYLHVESGGSIRRYPKVRGGGRRLRVGGVTAAVCHSGTRIWQLQLSNKEYG